MKKIVAILSIVALASCGNGATSTEVKTDSTNVTVDSTKTDSLVVDSVQLGGAQQPASSEMK
jgi:hypothetical protein